MNKTNLEKGFTVIETVFGIAVVALIGYAGWTGFNYYQQAKKPAAATVPSVSATPAAKPFCGVKETTAASNGTFCSEDIGIKFTVSSIFAGKLAKADNYAVKQSGLDTTKETSAGNSEFVYSAKQTNGTDSVALTIAREPLRSGNAGISIVPNYFDVNTRKVNYINLPIRTYNSTTNNISETGTYSIGDPVESFMVGDMEVFQGGVGDAGVVTVIYFMVVNEKIIKVSLYLSTDIISNRTPNYDTSKLMSELNAAIKQIEVIKQ